MDAEELIEERTGENEYERKARELGEFLQELRVMLPGVQVLFAFLLTVPFSARFGYLTAVQQVVFSGRSCVRLSPRGCCWRRRPTTGYCGGGRPGSIACGWPIVSPSRAWCCSWWRWSG